MKKETSSERRLTPKEAAHKQGVTTQTVYNWIRDGVIKAERKGKRLLFIKESEVFRVGRG